MTHALARLLGAAEGAHINGVIKSQQQRLVCLPEGRTGDGTCSHPFMLLNDVGVTFGEANYLNLGTTGSVNIKKWSQTPTLSLTFYFLLSTFHF